MHKLYQWQNEASDKFEQIKQGTVKATTGSGKTTMAITSFQRLISSNKIDFCVVLVPTRHLQNQWKKEFNSHGETHIGLRGNGHNDKICKVNIWINNTARKFLSGIKSRSWLLIVDECHKIASPENSKMMRSVNPNYVLGLSATPANSIPLIGSIFYEFTFRDAEAQGIIHKVSVTNVGYDMSESENKEYDNYSIKKKNIERLLGVVSPSPAYINKIKAESRDPDIRSLCETWLRVCQDRKRALWMHETRRRVTLDLIHGHENRKILIVGESVLEAQAIYECLKDDDENVTIEHSYLNGQIREKNVSGFAQGDYRIIVSARTLDTGADFPDVDMVMIHSSSSNVLQFIQRIGRGVRRAGNPLTVVFRPFAIGTSDDVAIDNLRESEVLPRGSIKIIKYPTGEELKVVRRRHMIKFSLLTNDELKFNRERVSSPPSFLLVARKFKPQGGVFHFDPENNEVWVHLEEKWKLVGKFPIEVPI